MRLNLVFAHIPRVSNNIFHINIKLEDINKFFSIFQSGVNIKENTTINHIGFVFINIKLRYTKDCWIEGLLNMFVNGQESRKNPLSSLVVSFFWVSKKLFFLSGPAYPAHPLPLRPQKKPFFTASLNTSHGIFLMKPKYCLGAWYLY